MILQNKTPALPRNLQGLIYYGSRFQPTVKLLLVLLSDWGPFKGPQSLKIAKAPGFAGGYLLSFFSVFRVRKHFTLDANNDPLLIFI